jgi:signal transduction histidine kinase
MAAFLASGFLVALAAIIDTSRFQSANPNAGTGIELQVVAAVVIGGASLMGGRGSFLGSFMGVLIIAVLNSGLASMGARDENKRLITGLVIVAAVILDRYRLRLAQQAEKIRQTVQRDAIQEERSRLARELHDTLQQELSGIAMQLDAVDAQLDNGKGRDLLNTARSMIRHSQTEARHAVWNLRCPELASQDLPAAIAEMASQVRKEHGLDVQWRVEGAPFRLSGIVENHLFRIAQEAMTNTVKHAQASAILLHLEYQPNRVSLRIEDDGRGFDAALALASSNGHFGLLGMKERARKIAGDIRFSERNPTGCCVEIDVDAPPAKTVTPPNEE